MRVVELLAPAKDLATGIVAINNGADAVYIGAPAFGARKAAANSIEDIKELSEYAHRFYCKVYVTLNTLLYDDELFEVEKLIWKLYDAGVDALIIQDMGILKLNLPPIPLHASTQMHNYDMERIAFIDKLGFRRIVLARELSLKQLREIREKIATELEVFIHGALCVSLSGQCYLSHAMSGRSANRGECAQPCRMKWSVRDRNGRVIIKNKYVLSLKDLNLSKYINNLIDIGINSFKIEGRLKDANYVSNIVSHYYSHIVHYKKIKRSGSGIILSGFCADPEKTFNRSYSDYFIEGRQRGLVNMDTPKAMGKIVGTVKKNVGNTLWVNIVENINNGDGICFFEKGELKGIRVNVAEGDHLICNELLSVPSGTTIYRNYDHQFMATLNKMPSQRKIRINIQAVEKNGFLELTTIDEDLVTAKVVSVTNYEKAMNSGQKERIVNQLKKCGESDFVCENVDYSGEILFIPSVELNGLKKLLINELVTKREENRVKFRQEAIDVNCMYAPEVDWKHNVVNKKAELFYKEHGVQNIEKGFEITPTVKDRALMHTRYCILHELGRCCKQHKNEDITFPLFLYNDKHVFRLEFDCNTCFMSIIR